MMGTELATRGAEAVRTMGPDLMPTAPKTPWVMRIEEHPRWETLSQLRVTMWAGVSLHRFIVLPNRIRRLLPVGEVGENPLNAWRVEIF